MHEGENFMRLAIYRPFIVVNLKNLSVECNVGVQETETANPNALDSF